MSKAPSTPAVRLLKAHKVPFTEHLYRYEEHGGTRVSAQELGVDEHAVVKTLIMEDETGKPLVVLMHGDLEVSTKALARQVGAKAIHICKPEVANRHSGYLVGWVVGNDPPFKAACSQKGVVYLRTLFGEGNALRLVPSYFSGYPWEKTTYDIIERESPKTYVTNIKNHI